MAVMFVSTLSYFVGTVLSKCTAEGLLHLARLCVILSVKEDGFRFFVFEHENTMNVDITSAAAVLAASAAGIAAAADFNTDHHEDNENKETESQGVPRIIRIITPLAIY